jgi:hypothetical protein
VDLPAILSDEDAMPEIMRAYAERMRRSVKPDGGRQEGGATSLLDSLGVSLYNTLASPSRLVNSHMAEYQPGVSVQDMPETMKYLPEVATNVVGLPGVMGAVPEGAMGSAAGGKIKAYHGSPHDFDKFDIKKIGTGEGAQAYGHGLYFAENEKVAREYRDSLAAAGATVRGKSVRDLAAEKYRLGISQNPTAEQDIADFISSYQNNARYMMEKRRPELVPIYDELKKSGAIQDAGRMYEVNINAHPDQFLDWDKTLAGQAPEIRDRVGKAYGDFNVMLPDNVVQGRNGKWYTMRGEQVVGRYDGWPDKSTASEAMRVMKDTAIPNYTVGDWYKKMNGSVAQSEKLREAGIPGIKYLDQGSRTAGQGTNNYVLFDDSLIEILRKYGLVGLLGGGAASQMQEQPQQ